MVSMAMLAILTAVFLNINQVSNTRTTLILNSNQIKSAIRLAQTYSLSIPNPERAHICGYGVYFDGSEVKIFYNYPSEEDFKDNVNICEDEEEYRTYNTNNISMVIEDYSLTENISTDLVGKSIFFKTPYAEVCDNEGDSLNNDFELKVISSVSGHKIIVITREGRVYEKE